MLKKFWISAPSYDPLRNRPGLNMIVRWFFCFMGFCGSTFQRLKCWNFWSNDVMSGLKKIFKYSFPWAWEWGNYIANFQISVCFPKFLQIAKNLCFFWRYNFWGAPWPTTSIYVSFQSGKPNGTAFHLSDLENWWIHWGRWRWAFWTTWFPLRRPY